MPVNPFASLVGALPPRGKARAYEPSCDSCARCRGCASPRLARKASAPGGLLFLLEQPTRAQDRTGEAMDGLFRRHVLPALDAADVDMRSVTVTFAVPCAGPDVGCLPRPAYMEQLEACRKVLDALVRETRPRVVVPCGKLAWDVLTQGRMGGRLGGLKYVTDVCFHLIPDQSLGYFVAPVCSLAWLARMRADQRQRDDYVFYKRRLSEFLDVAARFDGPFPDNLRLRGSIKLVDSRAEAVAVLRGLLEDKPEYLAFDYETDGLKLERDGMLIRMVGLSTRGGTWAMPFYNGCAEFEDAMRALMLDPAIGKVAHHAKYESRCTLAKLGVMPAPWVGDTMYMARVLDNTTKVGLKYLAYMELGVAGYDEFEDWMEGDPDERLAVGDNAKNRFEEVVADDELRPRALRYVGQDALYTRLLYERFGDRLRADRHLSKGERLLRGLVNPLVELEANGLCVDMDVLDASIAECRAELAKAEADVLADDAVRKHWDNPASFKHTTGDLAVLLYDKLGVRKQRTDKGALAVDSEALEDIGLPICEKVLAARKYSKILETYLLNIKREAVRDGRRGETVVHSVFNMHIARTYRSSCSAGVNLQNIPVRDEVQNRLIRTCLVPPRGMRFLEFDYKACEISVSYYYSKDRNMGSFLRTGGDMHLASAKKCMAYDDAEWEALDKDRRREVRQAVKGRFNFAEFYGGGAKAAGANLWRYAGRNPWLMEHLAGKGLRTLDLYIEHMRECERHLWEVQFPGYAAWRRDVWEFYQRHGYVELLTGFRCRGPLNERTACNSPVQGTAAHLLLTALCGISAELARRGMSADRVMPVAEIHDAEMIACRPEDVDEVKDIARRFMVDELPNRFPWMTVPLSVELEATDVREDGGSMGAFTQNFGYI